MGKITCLHQQKVKIGLVCVLFILIILTGKWPVKSQEIKNLPTAYGYYILKDGELVSIPKMKTIFQTPFGDTSNPWGILGLDSKPEVVIEDQRPVILIHDQGLNVKNFSMARLWRFENLRAQNFCGMSLDPISFKESFGVEKESLQPFGKWTPVGIYDIKGGPLPNRPDIIRIIPQEKLPSGIYAIYQGRDFISRAVQKNPNLSVWPFEISGAEPTPLEPAPVENPRVKFIKCCISDKLEGIEDLKIAKDNFLVSENQIITYFELQGHRAGEIFELIWFRPDGTIQERQKQVLSSSRRIRQSFNPDNLLMPGKWKLAIKIYGELVKRIPFQVSVNR